MISYKLVLGKIARNKWYIGGGAFLLLLFWIFVPWSVISKDEKKMLQPIEQYEAMEVEGHNYYIREPGWFRCGPDTNCTVGKRRGRLFSIIPMGVLVMAKIKRGEEFGTYRVDSVEFPWWSFAVWWLPNESA